MLVEPAWLKYSGNETLTFSLWNGGIEFNGVICVNGMRMIEERKLFKTVICTLTLRSEFH
jgi:hypothetical protein